jgi:hypothetical protein
MSFFVKTSMLRGTSCRFSSRLRAVTTISCSPEEVSAGSAAGARGGATASAAATARLILEIEADPRSVAHIWGE